MTDRTTSDLAAILTPPPSAGVQFAQGKILTWDRTELRNTVEWRGVTLRDLPMVEGLNNLVLKPGDIVGLLGWAPENSKGVGSWWILGKLSNPGEFIADLTFYLGQVRFRTPDNAYDQVYFGSDIDGEPLTILFFGDAGNTRAFQIFNTETIRMQYTNSNASIITTGPQGGQTIQIKDQAGNDLFASNGLTGGVGMADPWLPYLITPTFDAEQTGTSFLPSTTSASFVPLWRGFNPVYHPRVSYGVVVAGSGVSEWRIRVNPGPGDFTVASGSSSAGGTFDVPNFGTTFTPGNQVEFQVEARNTGGGTTRVGVDRLYGRQS